MAKTKQDIIDELGYITRQVSEIDSEFGMHHLHLDNKEEVSIKNMLSNIFMQCIDVRQRIQKLQ